jgi:hypothetical protein
MTQSRPLVAHSFYNFLEADSYANRGMDESTKRSQPLGDVSNYCGYVEDPEWADVLRENNENYFMKRKGSTEGFHESWDLSYPTYYNSTHHSNMSCGKYYQRTSQCAPIEPYYGNDYDRAGTSCYQYRDEDNLSTRLPRGSSVYHYPSSYYRSPDTSGYSDNTSYPRKTSSFQPRPTKKLAALSVSQSENQQSGTSHKVNTCFSHPAALHDKKKMNDVGALQSLDIVCGRGAPKNFHYGNQVFLELVKQYQTKYFCAKRSDKSVIALKLLDIIKARGGRFVRRQKAAGRFCWEPISDKSAYERVCQALRDGTPDLQRQVLSTLASRAK